MRWEIIIVHQALQQTITTIQVVDGLLIQAQQAGELPEDKARELIENLEQAKKIVQNEKKPPKAPVIEKLQRVFDVIDDMLDTFNESKHPAALLIKALPIAALLIKLAAQIFP